MKNIVSIIIVSLLLLVNATLTAGGGWPQPKNGGYIKLAQWWVIADQHFTDVGKIDPNITNGIFNTSIYGEYGVTDRLTAIAYVPFFSRAFFNNTVSQTTGEIITPGEAINSFGDSEIYLKYGLITNKPIVLSATIGVGIPLGIDDGGTDNNLQTGDGEFNQIVRIDASTTYKLGKLNAYASIYAGFNNRTKGFSDEWRYGIETGANLFKDKLTAILRLNGVSSLKNGDTTAFGNSTSIFANNSEFVSFSPEIAYNITSKFGVSASVATALSGKIIFANPSYAVGVYFKW